MAPAATPVETVRHPFEFRGTGGEYFRIWIVNLALSIVTLGIFSAWAKVRSKRYFNGSTFVAGHSFDYHASGLRILIGRAIALGLLLAYQLSIMFVPLTVFPWLIVIAVVLPWLVVASIRFNARNTSYRNVRFNFTATYGDAFKAYIGWPLLGMITLGVLMPMAARAKETFYVDHHRYGGRYFEAKIPLWRMYLIYLFILVVMIVIGGAVFMTLSHLPGGFAPQDPSHQPSPEEVKQMMVRIWTIMGVVYVPLLILAPAIHTMIVNLTIRSTMFDEKHRFETKMSPWMISWIIISNAVLTLITIGLYYPWAKVRLARYQLSKLTLVAVGDVDSYVSEVFDTQGAVGEEIGSFMSFDFGL